MTQYLKLILFGSLLIFGCTSSQDTPAKNLPSTQISIESAATYSKQGEWSKAAKLYEQLYLKDLPNEELNYETATNYLKANYPQKALEILTNFDKKYQDRSAEFNGRMARIAKAYYQLGNYEEIENVVKEYDYPKMYRGLAREHLKALIQLGKFSELANYFSSYQESGIYDDKGKKTNSGFLYRAICNALLLVGQTDLLKVYADQYHDWAILRQEKDQRNLAIATFYQQDLVSAIKHLKTAISTEKSPRHRMELIGLLGICYAKKEKPEQALAQIEIIKNFEKLPNRHDAFGAKFYHHARIEVALNQKENALQSLKNALAAKAEFWSNRFREDGLMKGLFSHEEFKKMVKHY